MVEKTIKLSPNWSLPTFDSIHQLSVLFKFFFPLDMKFSYMANWSLAKWLGVVHSIFFGYTVVQVAEETCMKLNVPGT
jgi:hypothetical protein